MALSNLNRLALIACTLALLSAVFVESVQSATAPRVPQELMQRARRDGQVRVIVELAVSGVTRDSIGRDTPSGIRRANIAQAQNSLRAGLRVPHRVHHQYRDVPYLAIEVGADAMLSFDTDQIALAQASGLTVIKLAQKPK